MQRRYIEGCEGGKERAVCKCTVVSRCEIVGVEKGAAPSSETECSRARGAGGREVVVGRKKALDGFAGRQRQGSFFERCRGRLLIEESVR
jgi:hypothetical protein